MVINFYTPVEIFFGKGAVDKVGEVARRFGFKALIITGRKSAKESGALERVIRSLISHGVEDYVIYDRVVPNPTDKIVNEGAEIAVREKVDFIVALGGGSALDTAKAVSIVSSNEGYAWDYVKYPEGSRLIPYLNRPVICISTTAGTGSEVDRYAVISNPIRKEKLVISHSLTYPRIALIDPELTMTMDRELTAITGFDALTHALEALTNRRENFIAEEKAVRAIELIVKWLPVAIEEPENYRARKNLSYASMLAGIAIDHLGVALIHSMEHPVSAHYPQIAHGLGLASLAPYVVKFSYKGNPEKYALFARLMGYDERPELAVESLVSFLEKIGLSKTLKDIGVEEVLLDRLAEDVYMLSRHSFPINPVEPSIDDVREIYQNAYEGKL